MIIPTIPNFGWKPCRELDFGDVPDSNPKSSFFQLFFLTSPWECAQFGALPVQPRIPELGRVVRPGEGAGEGEEDTKGSLEIFEVSLEKLCSDLTFFGA